MFCSIHSLSSVGAGGRGPSGGKVLEEECCSGSPDKERHLQWDSSAVVPVAMVTWPLPSRHRAYIDLCTNCEAQLKWWPQGSVQHFTFHVNRVMWWRQRGVIASLGSYILTSLVWQAIITICCYGCIFLPTDSDNSITVLNSVGIKITKDPILQSNAPLGAK